MKNVILFYFACFYFVCQLPAQNNGFELSPLHFVPYKYHNGHTYYAFKTSVNDCKVIDVTRSAYTSTNKFMVGEIKVGGNKIVSREKYNRPEGSFFVESKFFQAGQNVYYYHCKRTTANKNELYIHKVNFDKKVFEEKRNLIEFEDPHGFRSHLIWEQVNPDYILLKRIVRPDAVEKSFYEKEEFFYIYDNELNLKAELEMKLPKEFMNYELIGYDIKDAENIILSFKVFNNSNKEKELSDFYFVVASLKTPTKELMFKKIDLEGKSISDLSIGIDNNNEIKLCGLYNEISTNNNGCFMMHLDRGDLSVKSYKVNNFKFDLNSEIKAFTSDEVEKSNPLGLGRENLLNDEYRLNSHNLRFSKDGEILMVYDNIKVKGVIYEQFIAQINCFVKGQLFFCFNKEGEFNWYSKIKSNFYYDSDLNDYFLPPTNLSLIFNSKNAWRILVNYDKNSNRTVINDGEISVLSFNTKNGGITSETIYKPDADKKSPYCLIGENYFKKLDENSYFIKLINKKRDEFYYLLKF